MSYSANFGHADDVVKHLDTVVPALADPLLKAKYVGFVAIVAVTVFELAIKDIFNEFGEKKHKVFGAFTSAHFDRISGRIRLKNLKEEHVSGFGEKYVKRFKKNLEIDARIYMKLHKRDFRASYGNIVSWRHDFAHRGKIATTATYEEAVEAYQDGKEVIHCLARCMRY